MSSFDLVFDEFRADVERVENMLLLISSFREFGGSEVPRGGDGNPLWPEAVRFHDQVMNVRTDVPILSGSLQLYLAGRFEYFVRRLVEVSYEDINSRFSSFLDLPDCVRVWIRKGVLDISLSPSRYGYDASTANALLKSYADMINSSGNSLIDSSVMSITESNMNSNIVADILKRVGVTEVWSGVGAQNSMKAYLSQPDTGTATKDAQSRLNSIMRERNQIAHPTSEMSFPDANQVIEAAKFLRELGLVLKDLVKVKVMSVR